jgi:3-methylfumaryl-CoA hydratase
MRFETLRHVVFAEGRSLVEEEQDIVYREAPLPGRSARPGPPESAPPPAILRNIVADPVQLFRFSALTFNGHRIHYDRTYAMEEEGYPGLVVHGPYLATLVMDHYLRRHPGADVSSFAFRALRPVFDIDPFVLGLSERHDSDPVKGYGNSRP